MSLRSELAQAVVLDLETEPIEDRPAYPPRPVGLAVLEPGKRGIYHAFGHKNGNTCSFSDVRARLAEIWASDRPLLFHNARFDLDVIIEHFKLPAPAWARVHDTMPLLFLDDPRAPSYGLKPSAERVLGQAPEERDTVIDWLVEHQPVRGVKLSPKPKSEHYAGAWICLAPVSIVGPYAVGDVMRTRALALKLAPSIERRGMGAAYDRERRLLPHIMAMEAQGVRVAVGRLRRDVARQQACLVTLDAWLRRRLKAGESINLDSGAELAQALLKAGLATEASLGCTPTGQVQTSKGALAAGVNDAQVLAVLKHRAQLGTCLRTFMVPWLKTAEASGGLIYTTWHSTRTERGGAGVGTRTGRLSSTPNFQNIAKAFPPLFKHEALTPEDRKRLPTAPIKLLPLPMVRSYIVPSGKGEVLVDRDFSGQELRLLGHFDGAEILRAYQADPRLDFHALAQKQINALLGINLPRGKVKGLAFCQLYGGGLGKIAEMLSTDVATAKQLKDAYLKSFPGLRDMYADMKNRAKNNEPIRTWGGREYYCEPASMVAGRLRQHDYKMVNVLIQGSAADVTKEALVRFADAKAPEVRVLMTVHDEVLASCPRALLARTMRDLREAMLSIETDVPMFSDGAWSAKDWAHLKPYKDPEGA